MLLRIGGRFAMRLIALLLISAPFLFGCDNSKGGSVQTPSPTPSPSPSPSPTTAYDSRLDTDVAGQDLNGNGLRDDLDTYLSSRHTGETLRIIVSYGQSYQQALSVTTQEGALDAAIKLGRWGDCLSGRIADPAAEIARFESQLVNTSVRLQAYTRFEALLGGSTFALPTAQEIAAFCAATSASS